MKKNVRLIYDIASCPMSMGANIEDIIEIYHNTNVALYNSQETPGCQKPQIINVPEGSDLKIIDINTKEGKEFLSKISQN